MSKQWTDEWNQWFDDQYEITKRIDNAVNGLSVEYGDNYKVALLASIIEHCAESMRFYISDESLKKSATNG